MNKLSEGKHPIVHPSWQDNGHMDNAVGQVIESFCGNYGPRQIGLDFALVRAIGFREEGTQSFVVASLKLLSNNNLISKLNKFLSHFTFNTTSICFQYILD